MLRAAISAVTAPPRGRSGEVAPGTRRFPRRAGYVPGQPWHRRIDWWRLAPVLAALLFAVVYLIWQPRTVDLAAHTFRADLFGEEGFTIWNGQWYGGHHTPAYSIISPPIAWLLGPPLALALAAVASAALFEPLARGYFGAERARWGSIWFGVATATLLFTSRLPFALGVAFGLAALLALQRRRYGLAIAFALLCPLGSPVAGLFLAMAGVAFALAHRGDRSKRREGIAIAAAAFIPPVFLAWAFPEGGWAPFPFTAYLPIPLFALACLDRAAPPGASAPLGGGPLRGGRDPRAVPGHADGRQRGPPRRALRRARPALRHLGPAVDAPPAGASAARLRLRRARLLAVVAGRARRDQVPGGPGREVQSDDMGREVPEGGPQREVEDRDVTVRHRQGGRQQAGEKAQEPARPEKSWRENGDPAAHSSGFYLR